MPGSSPARRLGVAGRGLAPWQSTRVDAIETTATRCRHGPPLFHALVGDVIGFALRWEASRTAAERPRNDEGPAGAGPLGERLRRRVQWGPL